jgi:hypothetical protein
MRSVILLLVAAVALEAQTWPLDSTTPLSVLHAKAEVTNRSGRKALQLIQAGTYSNSSAGLAAVSASDFEDGTIEVDLAGLPREGAAGGARGFIGVAFRLQDATHYEAFYIRPTNGRADDQLRRNHATQYIGEPEFPWERLRKESPGVYESYADLVPGQWTKVKIVVSGVNAQLFVNNMEQPCLIVNDLKHGKSRGKIALWVGPDTEGYFANLVARK